MKIQKIERVGRKRKREFERRVTTSEPVANSEGGVHVFAAYGEIVDEATIESDARFEVNEERIVDNVKKINIAENATTGSAHWCASDLLKQLAVEAKDGVRENEPSQVNDRTGCAAVDVTFAEMIIEECFHARECVLHLHNCIEGADVGGEPNAVTVLRRTGC
jgi:hypothetical protein